MQEQEDKQQKATTKAIQKLDTTEFKYHKMSKEDVLKDLQTTLEKGLTQQEAAARLKRYGENQLDEEEGKGLWELIVEQFEDLLVRILLAAATISFIIALLGDGEEGLTAYVEPFVILLILVINAVIAIWQDQNADDALEALKQMQATESKCLRDGKWSIIPATELVPGDIVEVRMGDCVPADMRVVDVKSINLQAGQAALTGESVSVQKNSKQLGEDAKMLQDQKNMLFSSTTVTTGVAMGVVSYTGMKTAIGRVHSEVQAAKEEEEDTPLKQKLDQFGDLLAKVIFVICFLVWVMNYSKFFDPIHGSVFKGCIYYFKIAIALAVAAIPEGLPAVITTCLALGTRKMAANNCIVRQLQSVETLGCTSVICSDKTGTLTRNEMQAVKFGILLGGVSTSDIKTHNVGGVSYSTEGQVIESFTSDDFQKYPAYKLMTASCAINNRARILYQDEKYQLQGEPTEGAIKVLAEKLGKYDSAFKATDDKQEPMQYSNSIDKVITRVATLEFSSERKSMSTVIKGYNGNNANTVLLKGAPEQVVTKCTTILSKDGKSTETINEAQKAELIENIKKNAGQGYRVLGFAVMLDGGEMKDITAQNAQEKLTDSSKYSDLEKNGTFLGYVCIQDPERPEVAQSIEDCKTAGINVIMITGDIKETAVAIAKKLNILGENANLKEQCFTGVEFSEMTDKQKKQSLSGSKGKVFSRVEPSHKRELVKHLIEMGHIVAMTGDGVNDAPALKQAHIGIAMGITGTEVAKQASDMVLADDNFATIVKAVEEGRAIYSNMKAFIRYLISSNIGEVASIFITAMLGIPEGFNSVQLLWVNLVTDGPPATALGFNPPDTDIMKKPPRAHNENLISNWVFIRYMVIGMYVGFATVGIFVYWYVYADWTGDNHTLVTFDQLSHWNECPTWENFKVNNFVDGLDLQSNPCKYFIDGKVKASTLSLSVLVVIEMLNALNAISEDNSLFSMPPWINPYLILAILGSIALHFMIVHVPFFAQIFSITALNTKEWGLVFAFSSPVIIIDEILKTFGRSMNAKELEQRLKQD